MAFLLFLGHLLSVFSLGVNAVTMESMEVVDGDALKHGYKFHNPVSADQNNPWISGPFDKKFQFHVGQQSWLSARESCLSQNSDLVTIRSDEELEWILSHYKPQGRHLRERQIQIGLFVDPSPRSADASMREWKWVNQHPLNSSILPWTSGEPFDHSLGKERCALLNVNERRIDDVDCDLGGGPMHFYRYICERTHENHIKHEELNNPLWKKLEDILVFFGISTASKIINRTEELGPGEDEEDYWEKAGNPVKVSLNASSTTFAPPADEENSGKDAALNTDDKKEAEKATENFLTSARVENSQVSIANSSAQEESDAISNTDFASSKPLKEKQDLIDNELSQQKENETADKPVEAKQPGIMVVHGTKTLMLENNEASTVAPIQQKETRATESDFLSPKRLDEQKAPELSIANDVAEVETASLETTRTTKADPLAHLADTLERTFAAISSDDVNGTETQIANFAEKTISENGSKPSTQIQSKIHSLERIISAVQKMIETHDIQAVKQQRADNDSNGTLKDPSAEQPLDAAATLLAFSENSSSKISSLNSIVDIIQSINTTKTYTKNNSSQNKSDPLESALNMEDDFLQAAADTKAHPNINSGDLIVSPNSKDDETIGFCGDPTHKHSEQDSSSVELEPEKQANFTVSQEKKVKIDKFLRSLRTFLDAAHPSQLKRLVDDGRTDRKPLVERLEQVVAMQKALKEAENPVDELKKLHKEKVKKEKTAADLENFETKSTVPESEQEESFFSCNFSSASELNLADPTSSKLDSLNAVQIQQLQTYSALNHLSTPTQEIIDAVLALQNHAPSLNRPIASQAAQKKFSNVLVLNSPIGVPFNENVSQESVTPEKTHPNFYTVEIEDPSSVFPHPNFTLLKKNETIAQPKELEERAKAEQKRIDGTYKKFLNSFTTIEGGNRPVVTATSDFIKRIQTADAQRLIVKQSPALEFRKDPGHIDTNTHGIVIEKSLNDVFDTIGDNFNKLIA